MNAEIDVGQVIAGKYELVRLIGAGAMGQVWLATHTSLGGQFAIKLVLPSEDEEPSAAAGRFQFEAQVSAKLSRKTRHIVSVSDHGEENGLAYLVMELLEGESLEARITMGPLSLAETVAIVVQVARALGHAHGEAIFHRDLKPANVFLTKDEDGRLLVKLLDFGIARTTKVFKTRSAFATGKDMVLGTPSYMSPEQACGLPTLDYRCDLWALAVVAYESLTQQIPWEGDTLENIFLSICTDRWTRVRELRPDLPVAIDAVLARALAPKLPDRFASAAELSDAFEALVDPLAFEASGNGGGFAAGRGRRSDPQVGLDPAGDPFGGVRRSDPELGFGGVRRSDPELGFGSARRSNPELGSRFGGARRSDPELGSDPVGLAVAEPTLALRRRRPSPGWMLAVIAAIATLGVVGFGFALRSLTSRGSASARPPPMIATTATATVQTPSEAAPAAEPIGPTTTTAAPATTGVPIAKGAARAATAAPPVTGAAAVASPPPVTPPPVRPPPVTPPPITPPPVTPAHPPAPPPTSPPHKPGDKSEVF